MKAAQAKAARSAEEQYDADWNVGGAFGDLAIHSEIEAILRKIGNILVECEEFHRIFAKMMTSVDDSSVRNCRRSFQASETSGRSGRQLAFLV